MSTSVQCWQTLTTLEPEKGTHQGTTKREDATSLKLATGQEAAEGNEPSPSGQWWSSHQAAVWPAIIDEAELAEEVEGMECRVRFCGLAERWLTKHCSPSPETEGHGGDPRGNKVGMDCQRSN